MIYLDHAAATPVDARVLRAMEPYFGEKFYNPSAAYLPAKEVAADYEAAKGTIAHAIGAKGADIVITAGATEANNLALSAVSLDGSCRPFSSPTSQGSVGDPLHGRHPSMLHHSAEHPREVYSQVPLKTNQNLMLQKKQSSSSQSSSSRVLYLVTEHDSVRRVAERYGGQEIEVLPNGMIDMEDLRGKLSDEVELVSVSLANNELGVIQPLAEIAALIREVRLDRMRRGVRRQLLLHSDASQALNLLDVNVARLGVDLMTMNAAKVYGPKGVGALYVAHGVRLKPVSVGGGQENGLRAGTENVPGVIGFARALELAHEHLNGNRKKYAEWRRILLSELEGYELINRKHCLDNFVVLCYNGIDAERLVFLLEEKGVYVATGAACAASKGVRSHVLAAIGLSDSQIAGSLRLTLGETNDEAQIHEAARIINEVVATERERIGR